MTVKRDTEYFHPRTLGEFNRALTALDLVPVSKTRLDEVLTVEPRERLVRALNRARNDHRALAYLNRFFGKRSSCLPISNGLDASSASFLSSPGKNGQMPEPKSDPNINGENQGRLNRHIYGSKGALCFEPDETRGGIQTVCLDAADAIAPKKYNWQDKIRLQMTRDELLHVTAVLFGFIPKAEGKNHGKDNSKGFTLEDQGDKLFMRVYAKGHNVKAVPIFPEDAFYVASLFLGQLKKNMPWLSANEILATLKLVQVARRIVSANSERSPQTRH